MAGSDSSASIPIGAHLGREDPLGDAEAVGAECVQIFLSDPQSWKKPPEHPRAEGLRASPLPLYIHAPYLINVCSPRNNVRYGSRKILQQTCAAAAEVGAAAVIVHGGHAEDDITEGPGRWVRSLEMLESEVPVYLENTAGGEHAVARRFEDLARLWEGIGGMDLGFELGFCFDTCHAHAAGEDLDDVVERAQAITGRIDLLHCNDSRDPAGTGADRHANLGEGQIGAEALERMIAACAGTPVVCETPGGPGEMRADLGFVRRALAAGEG
jgi:deoxyribonuclease IV